MRSNKTKQKKYDFYFGSGDNKGGCWIYLCLRAWKKCILTAAKFWNVHHMHAAQHKWAFHILCKTTTILNSCQHFMWNGSCVTCLHTVHYVDILTVIHYDSQAEGHWASLTVTFYGGNCAETHFSLSLRRRHVLSGLMEKHRCLSLWFLVVSQSFLTPANLTKGFVYGNQVSLMVQLFY